MKVIECNGYNSEFPEVFSWGHVDSIKYSNLASNISNHIKHDLKTVDRLLVPGLRKALNIIAEETDF
uniref:Uncharacterized protein n=1 Tax=viral metagenome TaxID=1070528 RepID=A0A6M3ILM3_9ZZZZ